MDQSTYNRGIFFRYRVMWHILFWIMVHIFYSITYGSHTDKYREEFFLNFYLLPIRILATYSFIYFIIPGFLIKRRFVAFSFLSVFHAMIYGSLIWIAQDKFYYCKDCVYGEKDLVPFSYMYKIFGSIITNYIIPAVAGAIVLFKRWYTDHQKNQDLEKEKLEAELKFLKSQIHPHFLFNTLNNLYALTLKKSSQAPDIVIRLSEMLDYMLYNSNEKLVKLKDEIKLITGFLELEKLRYGDRLDLRVDIQGEESELFIAPLLLLPFIENSFKYGARCDIKNPSVEITLDVNDTCLIFTIVNTYCAEDGSQIKNDGIGLKNVIRRLDLIYPGRYELKFDPGETLYKVYLCIRWTDNVQDCIASGNSKKARKA
jgi:sensor histidine kinase YesM